MTPDKANLFDNVYGGDVLKLLDQVAYACASRHAERHGATLSLDQATFREPIHADKLPTFLASVNFAGNTSVEMGTKVIAEDILTQATRYVNSYFLTMVTMDENRKLCHAPTFTPANPGDVRCRKAAELRRYMRRQFEEKFNQIRADSILSLEALSNRAVACR